jgi:hypothetical protein
MRHLRIPQNSVLISEILDTRTKMVASEATLNDYVTSNELVSMALAMVSEQREVNVILKELFSAYGNEMYVCTVLRLCICICIHTSFASSQIDLRMYVCVNVYLCVCTDSFIRRPTMCMKELWRLSMKWCISPN